MAFLLVLREYICLLYYIPVSKTETRNVTNLTALTEIDIVKFSLQFRYTTIITAIIMHLYTCLVNRKI